VASNIEVWADYSKDRFESSAKRVDEFRNWARQLSAAVAVVIGLELTLVASEDRGVKIGVNRVFLYSAVAERMRFARRSPEWIRLC
jgi:hypothetical protein